MMDFTDFGSHGVQVDNVRGRNKPRLFLTWLFFEQPHEVSSCQHQLVLRSQPGGWCVQINIILCPLTQIFNLMFAYWETKEEKQCYEHEWKCYEHEWKLQLLRQKTSHQHLSLYLALFNHLMFSPSISLGWHNSQCRRVSWYVMVSCCCSWFPTLVFPAPSFLPFSWSCLGPSWAAVPSEMPLLLHGSSISTVSPNYPPAQHAYI